MVQFWYYICGTRTIYLIHYVLHGLDKTYINVLTSTVTWTVRILCSPATHTSGTSAMSSKRELTSEDLQVNNLVLLAGVNYSQGLFPAKNGNWPNKRPAYVWPLL